MNSSVVEAIRPGRLEVVAAVIEQDDAFLLTLRPDGTHLAGHWEFPGGKCLPHESHSEALQRELFEELDIVARVGDHLRTITHRYPDREVTLHFYRCRVDGVPKPMLGQAMAWVPRASLGTLRMPPADAGLVQTLVTGEQ